LTRTKAPPERTVLYQRELGYRKFNEQSESDRLIEDLEIITGLQREDFHVRPEENGATLYGPIKIKELTKRGDRHHALPG